MPDMTVMELAAVGIDVDVFRELPAAEAWLEEGNGTSGSKPGEKPLPH